MKNIATRRTEAGARNFITSQGRTPGEWVPEDYWNGRETLAVETVWDVEPVEDGFAVVTEMRLAPEPAKCAWFALCPSPAAGTVKHPVLGEVPTCQRCADRFELPLVATETNR